MVQNLACSLGGIRDERLAQSVRRLVHPSRVYVREDTVRGLQRSLLHRRTTVFVYYLSRSAVVCPAIRPLLRCVVVGTYRCGCLIV